MAARKKTTKKMGTFRQRATKHKKQIEQRHKESQERRDEGFSSASILDKENFPTGLEVWNPSFGEHIIDVIPFYAGKQHPRDPEGDWSYCVDFWVHRNVGPANQHFACNQRNFEKRCAVCDYIAAHDLSKEEFNRIKAKRRCVYLVWVHDEERKEEKKGIQVWEVSHFFFEKKVDGIAKKPRGGGIILWADHDRGKSVVFRIKKGGKFETPDGKSIDSQEYSDFSFLDREEPIPDKLLDHGIALDELVFVKSVYKDAKKELYASEEDEDLDKEVTDDDDTETDDSEPDDEIDEADDDVELEDEEDQEDEVEGEDESDEFADEIETADRKALRIHIRDCDECSDVKVYKKDSDDDIRAKIMEAHGYEAEAEDEGEEEAEGECPAEDGTYGKDADSFEECLDCDLYDKCAELSGVA